MNAINSFRNNSSVNSQHTFSEERTLGGFEMDKKDKEPKGTAATASKMAASKQGGESPSPNQGAAGSQQQNQGNQQQNQGNQNQGNQQDLLQQAKQTTNEVVSQVQQQAN